MDPEIVAALIGPILTAGLATLAVGFPAEAPPDYRAWEDHSYPEPLPNAAGQVGAGYPPPG